MIDLVCMGQNRIQWRAVVYTSMCSQFGFRKEKSIRD